MKFYACQQFKSFFSVVMLAVVLFTGCDKNSGAGNKIPSQKPHPVTIPAAPGVTYEKPLVKDTLRGDSLQVEIAVDSLASDTNKNVLRESSRKLDARYFKKSFSLHKRVYIAFLDSRLSNPS